ncbi:hypothetical protein BKA69DRAFT_763641 [Paraphysoderma sedebokerense]|nr:hypothetical protein BKA69DRAFT_763641 [Paraphysoderma sedebokerense]
MSFSVSLFFHFISTIIIFSFFLCQTTTSASLFYPLSSPFNPNPSTSISPYETKTRPHRTLSKRQSQLCQGATKVEGDSGVLTDGSGGSDYSRDMTCIWNITVPSDKVILVEFTSFSTECNWDYLSIFDGTNKRIAQLCGRRDGLGYSDVLALPGPDASILWESDTQVNDKGFDGSWRAVDPCYNNCYNRGTCVSGKCVCNSDATGILCEKPSIPASNWSPRFHLSSTYDGQNDIMYVSGGQSLEGKIPWDMWKYQFSTQQWEKVVSNTPTGNLTEGRAGHTMFMVNGEIYTFGGLQDKTWRTDLWKYNNVSQKWEEIPTKAASQPSDIPLILSYPTVIPVERANDTAKLYVFGGLYNVGGGMFISRRLYVLDLTTFSWTQKNESGIPTYASPGVYYPETDMLYIFGLRSLQRYHIGSDLWYSTRNNNTMDSRIHNTARLLGGNGNEKGKVVLFGGQMPPLNNVNETLNECFWAEVKVFDADCEKTTVTNPSALQSKRRMGHSMIMKNNTMVIVGGHNGVDLADMVQHNATLPVSTVQEKKNCKATNYCKFFNDCDDCLTRSYCGWCGNTCAYIGDFSSTQIQQSCNSTCPLRTPIDLNQSYNGTLVSNASIDCKIYINEPDDDIFFNVDVQSSDSPLPVLDLTLLFREPPSKGKSPVWVIKYDAQVRFEGFYVLRVSNENPNTVTYSIRVTTQPGNNRSNNPDTNPYIAIAFAFCALSLFMALMIQKLREIMRGRPLAGTDGLNGSGRKKVTPVMYTIDWNDLVGLKKEVLKSAVFGLVDGMGGIKKNKNDGSAKGSPKTKGTDVELRDLKSNILSTAVLTNDGVVDHDVLTTLLPLSVQSLAIVTEERPGR